MNWGEMEWKDENLSVVEEVGRSGESNTAVSKSFGCLASPKNGLKT